METNNNVSTKSMGQALQLLIIEDSAEDTEILVWELRRGGYDVAWKRVETADDMVSAIEQTKWDIIVSDYVMPKFSGIDALRILKERAVDIPFIICSGKVGESTAVEAMLAGADDYLIKGNLSRLLPAIKRSLAEAEERRQLHKAERELRLLRQAIDTIPLGVTISDSSGKIIYANPAEGQMHGYFVNELIGMIPSSLATKTESVVNVPDNVTLQRESVHVRKDGSVFPVYVISVPLNASEGETMVVVSVCEDITERKQVEEKLRYMSTHDALTGLYNRAYFELELERLDKSRHFPVSVIMFDVDGLKSVNDLDGHQAGDMLLKETGKILSGLFRVEDMLARIGGDEFIVLLPGTDMATVEKTIERIKSVIAEQENIDCPKVKLSLGAATAHEPGTLLECINLADARMYQNKISRLNRA